MTTNLLADCRSEVARMRELITKRKSLPCPFCGSDPVITNVRMSDHSFKVGCYNELCWGPGTDFYSSESTCVEAWNKRVNSTEAECALVEGLCNLHDVMYEGGYAGTLPMRDLLANWLRARGEK